MTFLLSSVLLSKVTQASEALRTKRWRLVTDFSQPRWLSVVSYLVCLHKVTLIFTHSLAIGLDATTAAAMLYHLYRGRSRFRRLVNNPSSNSYMLRPSPTSISTRGVISWLMMYYVNTGVLLAWVLRHDLFCSSTYRTPIAPWHLPF